MNERWWESPVCFVCNYWWGILIAIVLVLAAFFTRNYWLPQDLLSTNAQANYYDYNNNYIARENLETQKTNIDGVEIATIDDVMGNQSATLIIVSEDGIPENINLRPYNSNNENEIYPLSTESVILDIDTTKRIFSSNRAEDIENYLSENYQNVESLILYITGTNPGNFDVYDVGLDKSVLLVGTNNSLGLSNKVASLSGLPFRTPATGFLLAVDKIHNVAFAIEIAKTWYEMRVEVVENYKENLIELLHSGDGEIIDARFLSQTDGENFVNFYVGWYKNQFGNKIINYNDPLTQLTCNQIAMKLSSENWEIRNPTDERLFNFLYLSIITHEDLEVKPAFLVNELVAQCPHLVSELDLGIVITSGDMQNWIRDLFFEKSVTEMRNPRISISPEKIELLSKTDTIRKNLLIYLNNSGNFNAQVLDLKYTPISFTKSPIPRLQQLIQDNFQLYVNSLTSGRKVLFYRIEEGAIFLTLNSVTELPDIEEQIDNTAETDTGLSDGDGASDGSVSSGNASDTCQITLAAIEISETIIDDWEDTDVDSIEYLTFEDNVINISASIGSLSAGGMVTRSETFWFETVYTFSFSGGDLIYQSASNPTFPWKQPDTSDMNYVNSVIDKFGNHLINYINGKVDGNNTVSVDIQNDQITLNYECP